jgi:pimeloyl-ACP methyl ester carboxylesterase
MTPGGASGRNQGSAERVWGGDVPPNATSGGIAQEVAHNRDHLRQPALAMAEAPGYARAVAYRNLRLARGSVEYLVDGPEDARDLLVFHAGTPSAAVRWPGLIEAASAAGMRVASYSRGGYGASPRVEGRSVADEAGTCAALADALGHDRFFTVGWSGGGPVALACAALLGDRVRSCMALASITPRVEAGPAWDSFWTPPQLAEWDSLSRGDVKSLIGDFEEAVAIFSRMTPRRLAAVGGPPDRRATQYGAAEHVQPALVRSMRRALSRGYVGYLDDNLAQARDWGFRVADIRVPVVVRHGELDRLVPIAHGRWLAGAIPGARATILPDAGHGSIALPWADVIGELVAALT